MFIARRFSLRRLRLIALHVAGISALLMSSPAISGEIIFLPQSPAPFGPGDLVTYDILMDFTGEQPLGGEFDIYFDASGLQYHSFTSTGVGGPPTPVLEPGVLRSWSLGSFGGLPEFAYIGTVSFTVLDGPCGSALVRGKDSRGAGGGWLDVNFRPLDAEYHPVTVTRGAMAGYNGVKQIRVRAGDLSPQLVVSEVIALSGGVDVATIENGATATGDGTGPIPGTTGGAAHADNAIDGVGPTGWPDVFFPDTDAASEFLLVTLAFPHDLEGLSIVGSTTNLELEIYDVEVIAADGSTIVSCPNQSANNSATTAIVNPKAPTILVTPLGNPEVDVGDMVAFEVSMDFGDDATIGGGIDIIYDPTVLRFVTATHSGIGLPKFQALPVDLSGVLSGWGAGDYAGLPLVSLLGVATFEVLQEMCATTALTPRNTTTAIGPWYSAQTFAPQAVIYNQPVLRRSSMPAVDDVKHIRVVSEVPTWLQISEVVAESNGVDVATASAGATATGDGTGSYPGTTGGVDHADNAIDGIGPSAWPDIFVPDTDAASEFLEITLDQPYRIDALSVLGRATVNERDMYDVTLTDESHNILGTCRRQSAINPLREAVVIAGVVADSDSDGVADDVDNCQLAANGDQLDSNDDGIGNACDPDINNDCEVNFTDLGSLKAAFFTEPGLALWDPDGDLTGDSAINFNDLAVMKQYFFEPPGPSAGGCN